MSTKNANLEGEDLKKGVDNADALADTNEGVLGTNFKSGRKKPRLSSLLDPPMDVPTLLHSHSVAMSIFEARLDEDEQRLYILEVVVGDAPEDSPQSSIWMGIDNLATRFSQLSDQLSSLQGKIEAQERGLARISQTSSS
jgi:hypothetical protein